MVQILVVEDEPTIRELLVDLLEDLGHHVLQAGTGAQALEVLAKIGKPDLVLTDISMPVMDGEALVKSLRSTDKFSNIPVIVMTANRNPSLRIMEQVGAIIRKPFDLEHVESVISAVLGSLRKSRSS
jgi:CheY-like chemotaxis protein